MMAANILNSDRAVEMSVYVIRAFVKMRAELAKDLGLARRLAEIEKNLIGHDMALRDLYDKIRPLLLPAPEPKRREIGLHYQPGRRWPGRGDKEVQSGLSPETHKPHKNQLAHLVPCPFRVFGVFRG